MKVALFDFDETLIKENSLGALFKAASGINHLWFHALPVLLKACFSRKTIRQAIKEHLYEKCLSGVEKNALYQHGFACAESFTPNKDVVNKLFEYHRRQLKIWIITASPELFVHGILDRLSWPYDHIIGTQLSSDDGLLTGVFEVECAYHEKIKQIEKVLDVCSDKLFFEYAYGNLPADRAMLNFAVKSFVVSKGVIYPYEKHKSK